MRVLARTLLLMLPFVAALSHAQVTSVAVSKGFSYVQSGPGAGNVALDPAPNNFGFGADVDGNNISGITPPTVSGPINAGALGAFHNGGVLKYSPGDRGWRYGANADDFGGPTQADLASKFGPGTYTFTVNGVSVPLNMGSPQYPNMPVMTLTGGSWQNGRYLVDISQPVTITSNAFPGYGTHADDLICIVLIGGDFTLPFESVGPPGCHFGRARVLASTSPGTNTLSYTIPANTLQGGGDYQVILLFQAIVDKQTNPGLPGSTNTAVYETSTFVNLKAEVPVFPMTVTGSIGPTTSTVTATIGYRPVDQGQTASTYTFAVAPQTIVQPGLMKDGEQPLVLGYAKRRAPPPMSRGREAELGKAETSVACVLAQLNSGGALKAVSASSMAAFVTGVLGSAQQAVQVLNGVATVNIGGASFYVGYGGSAQSMLTNGITRNVIAAPGANECRPQPPQTGWWWNPSEGGRGYSIEVQGNKIFYASFLYDDAGRSNWFVATGFTSIDGSLFTSDLLRVTNGQTLGGAYRAPGAAQSVGPFTLSFTNGDRGTMVWPGGTVAIERFDIVPNGLRAAKRANQPETGWWWNQAESGRGFFIEWQDGVADLAGYMYDDQGNAVWYLSVQSTPDMRAFSGSWWLYSGGQSLTGAYKPATRINDNVAPVTITFTSDTTATMTLPNGRTTNLTRHRF